MIVISDKTLCCGCTACVNACPVQCIVMRRDKEGFDYPVANPDMCIRCSKCEAVCPVLNQASPRPSSASYACRSEDMIEGSSSGGVFPILARRLVDDGGVVFGAVMNEDMTVGHTEAVTYAEIDRMRGSRYVQSDLYAVYEDVRAYLQEGRKVMFTGVSCQIAGLKSFLGKEREGLLTVECACHGAPSPGLWARYVDALQISGGSKVVGVDFRDKSSGWRKYSFSYALENGSRVSRMHHDDPYMALFIQDMTLRPSCYRCPSRSGRSGSDILLADMWNVEEAAPWMNDDKGASLVVAYTTKGESALKSSGLDFMPVDEAVAKKRNAGFMESLKVPDHRAEFFSGLDSVRNDSLISYMDGFVERKTRLRALYESWHSRLSRIKRKLTK